MSKIASYAAAIRWIAENDDTEWLDDGPVLGETSVTLSVTASMVADLFGRDDDEVARDIRTALERYLQKQRRGA